MAINPGNIGEGVTGQLGDLFQGEVEIAGKKIPKVAIIAGGGGLIVLLYFVTRGKGGVSGSPFRPSQTGDSAEGVGSDPLNAPFEGGVPGGAIGGVEMPDLQTVIADSQQQLQDSIDAQIGGIQDQINQLPMDYPVAPLPTDSGFFPPMELPGGFDVPYFEPYNPGGFMGGQNPEPVPVFNHGKAAGIPVIKPSNAKPQGGIATTKTGAKLGVGVAGKSRTNSPTALLNSGSKPTLGAVTNFDKKPPPKKPINQPLNPFYSSMPIKPNMGMTVKPGAIGKKPTVIPYKPPQKTGAGGVAPSPKPKPPAVTTTNKVTNSVKQWWQNIPKPKPVIKPTIKTAPKPPTKQPSKAVSSGGYNAQAKPYSYVPYNSNVVKTGQVSPKKLGSKKGK